jgi:hypothetical protein
LPGRALAELSQETQRYLWPFDATGTKLTGMTVPSSASAAEGVTSSPLGVLGFSPDQEALYRLLLRRPEATLQELSELARRPVEEVGALLTGLADAGVVDLRGETVAARPPHHALAQLIGEENRRLETRGDQLQAVRRLLPEFTAEHLASSTPKGVELTMEIVEGADIIRLARSLTATTTGDLLWLRPDPWNITLGPALTEWVKGVVTSGRRSRAIYPARVFEEAPGVIRERAQAGEHVRILAEVPCRLAIMGNAAIVEENLEEPNSRRVVIRQESIVRALTVLFESLWEKAMAVPGLDAHEPRDRAGDRGLLLGQLAAGAKDEQIARALGMSLRTVRRRVAEVTDELGAQSRFQAGVEAVRRGWI